METLSQLISYDEVTDSLQIHDFAHIQDSPKYSHRGIMIDSARNFIPLMVIKKIIGEFRAENYKLELFCNLDYYIFRWKFLSLSHVGNNICPLQQTPIGKISSIQMFFSFSIF